MYGRKNRSKPAHRQRGPVRLGVEMLEDRTTPAQLTVTSALDPAVLTAGTLRYAVNQANGDAANGISDTIVFNTAQMGGGTIALHEGELVLSAARGSTITIAGGGQITINGNNGSRVFEIEAGSVTISGTTITGGRSPNGGGILNYANLTLNQDILTGNHETAGGNGGGAILSWGGGSALTIDQTTISNNSATWTGGGISLIDGGTLLLNGSTVSGNTSNRDGGGITLQSITHNISATVENCTIANNTASLYSGGGLLNIGYGSGTNASLMILDSTIADNSAPFAGGVSSWAAAGTVTTQYGNTIFAANSNSNVPYQSGTLISLGHNLSSDATGNLIAVGDRPSTAVLLGPLGNNGGPTQTMALLSGSPAIGAGTLSAGLPTDQRGLPRTNTADIGAYQTQSAVTFEVSTPTTAVTAGSAFQVTVTALDHYGNVATAYNGSVTLTSSDGQAVSPSTVELTNGVATVSVTLSVADTLRITAAAGTVEGTSNIVVVAANQPVSGPGRGGWQLGPGRSLWSYCSLVLDVPATAMPGTSFGATVTLVALGRTVNYTGVASLECALTNVANPPILTFPVPLTNGRGAIPVTFNQVGTYECDISMVIAGTFIPPAQLKWVAVSAPTLSLTHQLVTSSGLQEWYLTNTGTQGVTVSYWYQETTHLTSGYNYIGPITTVTNVYLPRGDSIAIADYYVPDSIGDWATSQGGVSGTTLTWADYN
jgi:hypothetical protein